MVNKFQELVVSPVNHPDNTIFFIVTTLFFSRKPVCVVAFLLCIFILIIKPGSYLFYKIEAGF